jgi:hypothetical protein
MMLMKRRMRLALGLTMVLGGAVSAAAAEAETIVIVAERLIDGRSDELLTDVAIVIEGGRISAVGGREIEGGVR